MKEQIKKELFDLLACPTCKAELFYNATNTALVCTRCKKEYEIKDGIPVLLPKK
jgi:uncharacterized protein YbaR (Trm112 family)